MEKKTTNKSIIRRYSIDNIQDTIKMAKTLKKHIIDNNLYVSIKGKNYVLIDGWQFAGGLLGLRPYVYKENDLSSDKEIKWKVDVKLFNFKNDKVIGRGVAICSSKETTKKSFDEFAILSMAQTRAIGKAYRNLIGWVMKTAGYEATPAEEMKKVDAKDESIVTWDDMKYGKININSKVEQLRRMINKMTPIERKKYPIRNFISITEEFAARKIAEILREQTKSKIKK